MKHLFLLFMFVEVDFYYPFTCITEYQNLRGTMFYKEIESVEFKTITYIEIYVMETGQCL